MIRPAEERDLEALKAIHDEATLHSTANFAEEGRTPEETLAWFQEHTDGIHAMLVYELEGRAVGYATLSRFNPKSGYDPSVELSLYVDSACRGRGIGDRLMTAILACARDCDSLHCVISLITSDNEPSIALHRKHGFTFCGRIEQAGRKFGRWLSVDFWQLLV